MTEIKDCLTFKHKYFHRIYSDNGEVSGKITETEFSANAHVSNYSVDFTFPSYPPLSKVEILTRSLSDAEVISKSQGYPFNDTHIHIVDRLVFGNAWITFLEYNEGGLVNAEGRTDKMVTTYPHRGFYFAVDLVAAALESKKLPKEFKENLGRIAHITSLDDYMDKKEAKLKVYPKTTLDEYFNRKALIQYKRPEYLPENNIRT